MRLHTVDRVLQTPVASELHVRIVTEVLLSIAILRNANHRRASVSAP